MTVNPPTEEQEPFFLTLYVLVWPVIVAGVLYVLGKAFYQEIREAKREGRPLI